MPILIKKEEGLQERVLTLAHIPASNKGCCVYTWRLPQQRQRSSMFCRFTVTSYLISLPGGGEVKDSSSLESSSTMSMLCSSWQGFQPLLFQVTGKVQARTAQSLQVPGSKGFGARRKILLGTHGGCLLEGSVSSGWRVAGGFGRCVSRVVRTLQCNER